MTLDLAYLNADVHSLSQVKKLRTWMAHVEIPPTPSPRRVVARRAPPPGECPVFYVGTESKRDSRLQLRGCRRRTRVAPAFRAKRNVSDRDAGSARGGGFAGPGQEAVLDEVLDDPRGGAQGEEELARPGGSASHLSDESSVGVDGGADRPHVLGDLLALLVRADCFSQAKRGDARAPRALRRRAPHRRNSAVLLHHCPGPDW